MIFTKPSITYEYLDKIYYRGIEVTNTLGKEKTLEMIESISINNPDVLDEFNKIIMSNKNLSDRIATLEVMNKKYVSDLSWGFPIICTILVPIFNILVLIGEWFLMLCQSYEENPMIYNILLCIMFPIMFITGIFYFFAAEFGC